MVGVVAGIRKDNLPDASYNHYYLSQLALHAVLNYLTPHKVDRFSCAPTYKR
jgi:hypothetical protein